MTLGIGEARPPELAPGRALPPAALRRPCWTPENHTARRRNGGPDHGRDHDPRAISPRRAISRTRKRRRRLFAAAGSNGGDLAVAASRRLYQIKDRSKDIIISGGENIVHRSGGCALPPPCCAGCDRGVQARIPNGARRPAPSSNSGRSPSHGQTSFAHCSASGWLRCRAPWCLASCPDQHGQDPEVRAAQASRLGFPRSRSEIPQLTWARSDAFSSGQRDASALFNKFDSC